MDPLMLTLEDWEKATRTVDGEARGEHKEGQIAVAYIIRNRATWDETLFPGHPEKEWWGTTIQQVCQHPWQFSCWNGGPNTDHIKGLSTESDEYKDILAIVKQVMGKEVPDPTGGSTTYKVRGTVASWDHAVAGCPAISIGKHDFWRLSPGGRVLPFLNNQEATVLPTPTVQTTTTSNPMSNLASATGSTGAATGMAILIRIYAQRHGIDMGAEEALAMVPLIMPFIHTFGLLTGFGLKKLGVSPTSIQTGV
jgi:hypothetical protein